MALDVSVRPSKKYPEFLLVSTTDFFFPLVQDPFLQGQIAAANVLSDLYAAGITEVDSVLMAIAISRKMNENEREVVVTAMMKGFQDKCKEAETEVSGGQTIFNPWCLLGGCASSISKKSDFLHERNKCRAGDVLVLTKPLGTQVAVNAFEWLNSLPGSEMADKFSFLKERIGLETDVERMVIRAYKIACASMARLNRHAAVALIKYGANSATDVTGFGLLGHLQTIADLQKECLSFEVTLLPVIRGLVGVDTVLGGAFKLLQGFSAETSGGILCSLPKDNAKAFCNFMEEKDGWPCWIIGRVVKGEKREARIVEEVEILEL